VTEILDTIHFGAILVDDIADRSELRKGRVAVHHIYGSTETINRAYLVIFKTLVKCQKESPRLVPFVLEALTEIHQGQDDSLVWRRDGFVLPEDRETALGAYQSCASLKTGALFRLVGQLLTGSHDMDELMTDYGWYCQLQNDCKNVFSKDVIAGKGTLAEDLLNGEYTYPIMLVCMLPRRFEPRFLRKKVHSKKEVSDAVNALQCNEVRDACLRELASVSARNERFAALWGREETMAI
ncbi:terpenoid synthase, partial [Bimuria novae-zelandiae CBS 107.79]